MQPRFLSHLLVIILLNLLVKPLYILAIEVTVQNRVGPEVYGLYFALLNAGYLLQIINDFGINIYNNRLVARNPGQIAAQFWGLIRTKLLLSVLFMAALVGFAALALYLDHLDLLLPIGLNLVLISMILFLRSNVSGLGLYRIDSYLSVADKALLILICGYLLFVADEPFTIYHFVYAQTIALGITAIITISILFGRRALRAPGKKKTSTRNLLKSSFPFALSVFLMTVYTRVDGVMIEKIADNGQYEAGLYAAGYRLLDAANMIGYLFAVLLLPMFSRLEGQLDKLRVLVSQAFRMVWAFAVVVATIGYFYQYEVMTWLYTAADIRWAGVFGYLIISFTGVGLMYVFGTFLTALGDIRKLNIIYGASALANVVLNFILIPSQGAVGAASATLLTQLAVSLALMIYALNQLQAGFVWREVLRPVIFLLGAISLTLFVRYTMQNVEWWIHLPVAGGLIAIFALLSRMVKVNDLRSMLSANTTPD